MKKRLHNIFIWTALIVYILGFSAPTVMAATPAANTTPQGTANNGQALEIAPPVIYLNADPGQTVQAQIFIRDISSGNLIVNGTVNDFVSSGEDGTPKIILDPATDTSAYSIVAWVQALPSLLLIPREIKSMTATIKVPKDASPGGHYGVIRFTSTPPALEGASGVSLAASIGVLVLLTVTGDVTEKLAIEQFSVERNGKKGSFFESGPIVFSERLKNNGNVHLQPTGQVSIVDMFGKKLASVNVNLPPGNILPNSIREFKQPLDKAVIGNKKLFGRYKATLTVTYGGEKKTLNQTIVFWVIPYKLVALAIAALIGLFFLLRFLLKRYNRRVLAQAQKNNRR